MTTARVSIANHYPGPVRVSVGGQTYTLAAQQGTEPLEVTPAASGNDMVSVTSADYPTCGEGDAQKYFYPGKWYDLTITKGSNTCLSILGPIFTVVEGLATTG